MYYCWGIRSKVIASDLKASWDGLQKHLKTHSRRKPLTYRRRAMTGIVGDEPNSPIYQIVVNCILQKIKQIVLKIGTIPVAIFAINMWRVKETFTLLLRRKTNFYKQQQKWLIAYQVAVKYHDHRWTISQCLDQVIIYCFRIHPISSKELPGLTTLAC